MRKCLSYKQKYPPYFSFSQTPGIYLTYPLELGDKNQGNSFQRLLYLRKLFILLFCFTSKDLFICLQVIEEEKKHNIYMVMKNKIIIMFYAFSILLVFHYNWMTNSAYYCQNYAWETYLCLLFWLGFTGLIHSFVWNGTNNLTIH